MSFDASNRTGGASVRTGAQGDESGGGGSFPGYGGAPPAVAISSAAGASLLVSRADHTHAFLNPVVFADTMNASGTKLTGIASAAYTEGAIAFVASVKAYFQLTHSALTTVANSIITASGKAGYQWLRLDLRSLYWEAQATWVIDPANSTGVASDDNTGLNSGAPLLTYTELAHRLYEAKFVTAAPTISVLAGTQAASDKPVFTYDVAAGLTVVWTGTGTTLYTSTVGTFTLMNTAAAAADDAQFHDAAVPGGSFTAAGVAAKGVQLVATTGGLAISYLLKDLGGTTCRTARPMTSAGANATFTAGETYKAIQLPKITFFRHTKFQPWGTQLAGFEWAVPGSTTSSYAPFRMIGCYISSYQRGEFSFTQNCCFDAGAIVMASNSADMLRVCGLAGCSFKGTGNTTIALSFGQYRSEASTLCFQGCNILIENGILNCSQLCFYDGSGTALTTGTGGRAHFLTSLGIAGVVGGKTNTGKLLAANQSSQIVVGSGIAVATGGVYLAASTTDATPIQAGVTNSAVAIPLDANMNGVFQTT